MILYYLLTVVKVIIDRDIYQNYILNAKLIGTKNEMEDTND